MSRRDDERKIITDSIDRHPDSPYSRRMEIVGVERQVDWGLLIDAGWILSHDINLGRYPGHARVKDTIREARAAVADAIEVFRQEIVGPAWTEHAAEEARKAGQP